MRYIGYHMATTRLHDLRLWRSSPTGANLDYVSPRNSNQPVQRPPRLRCGYTAAMLAAFVFRPRLWRTPAGSSTPFCGCVLLGGGPTKAPTRYGLSPRVSFCRRRGCFNRVPSNARVWRSGVSSFLGLVEGSWSGVTLPLPWQVVAVKTGGATSSPN